jgi:hypothetical protein
LFDRLECTFVGGRPFSDPRHAGDLDKQVVCSAVPGDTLGESATPYGDSHFYDSALHFCAEALPFPIEALPFPIVASRFPLAASRFPIGALDFSIWRGEKPLKEALSKFNSRPTLL